MCAFTWMKLVLRARLLTADLRIVAVIVTNWSLVCALGKAKDPVKRLKYYIRKTARIVARVNEGSR